MDTQDSRPTLHAMPFVRLELAVLGLDEGGLKVLLGRRAGRPHRGQWALPGGVLRIDLDASLDAACQRVAQERLGIDLPGATQLCSVGGPKRDPRAAWALSVVYRCTATPDRLAAAPGKRIEALQWADAEAAAQDAGLALDHAGLVRAAVDRLRADVEALSFPAGLLPEIFTLGELQVASEAVLGRPLDKSSFRRRLDAAECVAPVEGAMRTGPFRPAQLYRLPTSSAEGRRRDGPPVASRTSQSGLR